MIMKFQKTIISLLIVSVLASMLAIPAFADQELDLAENYICGDYGYTINEDGSATIVWFNANSTYAGNDEILSIPSSLDGHPVSEIGVAAFWYYAPNTINTIIIPEGVSIIRSVAFSSMYGSDSRLTTIYLPSTLKLIEGNAFSQQKNLKTIVCYSRNVEIEETAFRSCNNATFYGYPGSTTEKYMDIIYVESEKVVGGEPGNNVFADITNAPAITSSVAV